MTLRIGGTNEIPGSKSFFDGMFFMMISVAVAFAIPAIWVQNRWLKRIDPEMAR